VEKEHVEKLLQEFEDHRDAIKEMINELNTIKVNIDRLIPASLDARYIRFFEEKVKSITALFNSLLEMRKEITKSVREEIDIRRKVDTKDGIEDIEDMIDVRRVAKKVEGFKEDRQKFKEKIERHDIEDYDDIEIPGVNTAVK
jgi:hypothetical protein